MKRLIIHPESSICAAGIRERRCVLERLGGPGSGCRDTLFFRFPAEVPAPADEDAESYLIAALMLAMKEGRTLEVRGEVSATLLANLTEFMAAWNCWLPREYRLVELVAERIRTAPRGDLPAGPALFAFSGGVDASFLVWTHHQRRRGWQSQTLGSGMFIDGFDIHLRNAEQLERAYRQAAATLATLGLPLVRIATNLRDLAEQARISILDIHVAALAACFQQFKRQYPLALVGSSEPYDALILPWGSSPVTDHLWSSHDLQVRHDGAGYSRTEKVALIADWAAGLANLRVCGFGEDRSRNCGSCEKCLRTRLNFLANGLSPPPALGAAPTLREILALRLRTDLPLNEHRSLLAAARRNGVRGNWMTALRAVLVRERLRNVLRDFNHRLRGRPAKR